MNLDHEALDRLIPLDSASHAAVNRLCIDSPFRYVECVTMLADGRTARLQDNRQFLGWTQGSVRRDYFFKARNRLIVMHTDSAQPQQIRRIESWPNFTCCRALSAADPRVSELGETVHKVVSRDGSLLFLAPEKPDVATAQAPSGHLHHRPATPAAMVG